MDANVTRLLICAAGRSYTITPLDVIDNCRKTNTKLLRIDLFVLRNHEEVRTTVQGSRKAPVSKSSSSLIEIVRPKQNFLRADLLDYGSLRKNLPVE
jgi:hypothetical protein